jgi:hypothetical protein
MNKSALIITSISAPNAVMKSIAAESAKHKVHFIVIGDTKSPADFQLDGCDFYSVEKQNSLPFRLARILPVKHYSRKNIGYLLCRQYDVIIETDDDNFPRPEFWSERSKEITTRLIENKGWTNVYRYFSDDEIWPRGFPLEQIMTPPVNSSTFPIKKIDCPIQQGLADENPDVDAVYRMNRKLPFNFLKNDPLALGNNTWCPFNSQNTTWYKEAFPLLYLPSFCSFRMTDIWRSFIAQRIAWTCGWPVLFHNATVWQERNEHNLLKDFEDEIPGYLNNAKICRLLEDLNLNSGVKNIYDNLLKCYECLTGNNFIGKEEIPLVKAWIDDLGKD